LASNTHEVDLNTHKHTRSLSCFNFLFRKKSITRKALRARSGVQGSARQLPRLSWRPAWALLVSCPISWWPAWFISWRLSLRGNHSHGRGEPVGRPAARERGPVRPWPVLHHAAPGRAHVPAVTSSLSGDGAHSPLTYPAGRAKSPYATDCLARRERWAQQRAPLLLLAHDTQRPSAKSQHVNP
jgi:hypothetical protein